MANLENNSSFPLLEIFMGGLMLMGFYLLMEHNKNIEKMDERREVLSSYIQIKNECELNGLQNEPICMNYKLKIDSIRILTENNL
jgi:hypothetical protein